MAWNAVLVDHPDERAGRSYMEHVVALAGDATPGGSRLHSGCANPAAPPAVTRASATAPAQAARIMLTTPAGAAPD